MIIKGKKVEGIKSNIRKKFCPVCNKALRYKPPCCGNKQAMLVCSCNYKEVAQ